MRKTKKKRGIYFSMKKALVRERAFFIEKFVSWNVFFKAKEKG